VRIFLDANILFSASGPASATRNVFEAAFRLSEELVTNPHAAQEAQSNLRLKRPELLPEFDSLIKRVTMTNAFSEVSEVKLPAQDVPVLAGAVGSRCNYLWTGDKRHFGKLFGKAVHVVTIVSGMQLADVLIQMGWKIREE
jgi:predicted nucleic acid-binding protein